MSAACARLQRPRFLLALPAALRILRKTSCCGCSLVIPPAPRRAAATSTFFENAQGCSQRGRNRDFLETLAKSILLLRKLCFEQKSCCGCSPVVPTHPAALQPRQVFIFRMRRATATEVTIALSSQNAKQNQYCLGSLELLRLFCQKHLCIKRCKSC